MNQAPIHRWCYEILIYLNWLLSESHVIIVLWAILFYIVNANDANRERMTRHNKSSPNTIEYVQRFLFHFVTVVCVFQSFFFQSTCLYMDIFSREKTV